MVPESFAQAYYEHCIDNVEADAVPYERLSEPEKDIWRQTSETLWTRFCNLRYTQLSKFADFTLGGEEK